MLWGKKIKNKHEFQEISHQFLNNKRNYHIQLMCKNTGSRIWKLPMEFHRDALKSWMHFLFVHEVGEGLTEKLCLTKQQSWVERRKQCHKQTGSPRAMLWCEEVNRSCTGQWTSITCSWWFLGDYTGIHFLSHKRI